MRRTINRVTGACLGGAVLFAALGVAAQYHLFQAEASWLFYGIAVALPLLALRTGSMERLSFEMDSSRQAQRDLREQIDQQRRSVDALADGLDIAIFICDERAHILYANRPAREIFGFEEPIGRSMIAVTLSYELEQLVLAAVREKAEQREEIVFSRPDERTGIAKAWPQPEASGRYFLSLYEVTDLRRLERIRQDFVANVSHELRTPMTLIRAMAETLLDETDAHSELAQRYLGKMIEEVDRLSSMTQDLLTLSAAESSAVQKQSCDLAEIVQEGVRKLTDRARDKGLDFDYSGPAELSILANHTQMTQVSLNLIENAINYTTEGEVRVSLSTDGGFATLAVRDTGIGIASEHQKRVFERFYRVNKGRSRLSGGTGLGLSIVKHIVEAHGGSVGLESVLNHGTTVIARIPVE